MSDTPPQCDDTAILVAKANAGDESAFDELIAHVSRRLCAIAHRMLDKYPHVRRWEQTDDVLQEALIRLHRSLSEVSPGSVGKFFGLATTLLRRTLIDLSRHYYGVYGLGARHKSRGFNRGQSSDQFNEVAAEVSDHLEDWSEFHRAVEQLPTVEKESFCLRWYGGLTQRQISEVLQISERTVIRRLNRARISLHDMLAEHQPTL